MSKKLYVIADTYFETCTLVTYDKNVIKRFLKYKCRRERYKLIVVENRNLRKDFENRYSREEPFIDEDGEIMLPLEYESFINSLFPTLISLQKSLLWMIVHLDVLKLSPEEERCLKNTLMVLKHQLSGKRDYGMIFNMSKMKFNFIEKEIL